MVPESKIARWLRDIKNTEEQREQLEFSYTNMRKGSVYTERMRSMESRIQRMKVKIKQVGCLANIIKVRGAIEVGGETKRFSAVFTDIHPDDAMTQARLLLIKKFEKDFITNFIMEAEEVPLAKLKIT